MIGFDPIELYALSDVGIRRSHNQDAHAMILAKDIESWERTGHVFVVADGMGGHAVGEKASQKAARDIPLTYTKYASEGVANALRRAFVEANAAIHSIGQNNKEFQGMGTTSTALVIRPEGAWIGHVGDSRVYRVRKDVIEQLTFDHSYVWEMARRQKIDPEEVQGIKSNVIIRSMGPDPIVQVDIEGPYPVEPGDVFVMCSDGLSGPVKDSEIGAVASHLPPAEACEFLVQLANLRGGPDNITVQIVRVGGPGEASVRPRRSLRSLVRHMHWSLPVLAGGVLLTCVAVPIALAARLPGLLLFLFASLTTAAGLVGLLIHAREVKKKQAEHEPQTDPNVYRSFPCDLDGGVVEKLGRAASELRDQINESYPQLVPAEYAAHHTRGSEQLKAGSLPDAFREYCRAMHVLARAYNKIRSKSEVFQPVWEKKKKA